MQRGTFLKTWLTFLTCLILVVSFSVTFPQVSQAAAGLSLTTSSSGIQVGQTLTVSIYVNTNGSTANAFQGTITYPATAFEGVRGSFAGGICNTPVTQPDPSNGSAKFVCGINGAGYKGNGLIGFIVLKAIAPANGTIGLSNCIVASNGQDITGSCSGAAYTIVEAGQPTPPPNTTPTPTPSSTATPSPTPKPTLKPTPTPSATPTPSNVSQALQGAETPNDNSPVQPPPVVPVTQHFTDDTPKITETPAPTPDEDLGTPERKTVSAAFQSLFDSFQEVKSIQKDTPGLIVVLVSLLPFLLFALAALFFLYRLYSLERRRRRAMDQLLELGLSEISSLEGKVDLLGEKGPEGIAQYKEEFKKAKENILGQLGSHKKPHK